MAKIYNPGTKLIIELNSGDIYEGHYYSGNKDEIILDNVSQYPSGEKYNFLYNFYKMEIVSIRKIEEEKTCEDTANHSEENSVSLCEGKYEKLKALAYDHIYIAIVDNTYYEAVKHINLCETVSVIGLGSNFGRSGKINVLAIGTKSKIFVFDLKLSGVRAVDMGLRGILESDDILKIVHNSKTFSDCLYHSHKITLRNVFDTQVADFMVAKREEKNSSTLRSFSDCLCFHLNLPNNILNIVEPSLKHLMQRPLINEIKMTAALEVAYLYLLRKSLERKILKNFNTAVDGYIKSMRDAGPTEALQLLDNNSTDMFDNLNII